MKPNYRHERTQKARTRELERQEKQHRREEKSAMRKSIRSDDLTNVCGEEVTGDEEVQKSAAH